MQDPQQNTKSQIETNEDIKVFVRAQPLHRAPCSPSFAAQCIRRLLDAVRRGEHAAPACCAACCTCGLLPSPAWAAKQGRCWRHHSDSA